jgi:hypothetical protein
LPFDLGPSAPLGFFHAAPRGCAKLALPWWSFLGAGLVAATVQHLSYLAKLNVDSLLLLLEPLDGRSENLSIDFRWHGSVCFELVNRLQMMIVLRNTTPRGVTRLQP